MYIKTDIEHKLFYSELRVRIYILEVTKHGQITHWRVEGMLNKEHYRHE